MARQVTKPPSSASQGTTASQGLPFDASTLREPQDKQAPLEFPRDGSTPLTAGKPFDLAQDEQGRLGSPPFDWTQDRRLRSRLPPSLVELWRDKSPSRLRPPSAGLRRARGYTGQALRRCLRINRTLLRTRLPPPPSGLLRTSRRASPTSLTAGRQDRSPPPRCVNLFLGRNTRSVRSPHDTAI
jgi:hypothetical protein